MKSTILTIFPAGATLQDAPSSGRREVVQPAMTTVNTLPSIESVILQKLLAEVEARQMARAQPTYVIEQSPPARGLTLVRALWGLLWALSIVVAVISVKYIDSQTMVPKGDTAESRSIERLNANLAYQNETFSNMMDSLRQVASTVASSAERTESIPALLQRLGNNLEQIRPAPVRALPQALAPPATPVIISTSPHSDDSAPIPMGGHVHPPIGFAVAPADVIVHHNSAGVMDYWLVPRIMSGVRTMVKVVPVLQTNAGTFIHDIAEVKDYILTSSGDWIEAPEQDTNK